MKKKLLAGVLAAVLLTGGVLAAYAANQSEMLVSLSYLTGTFWNDLKLMVRTEVEKDTTAFYNEAVERAKSGGSGADSTFIAQSGVNGDVVSAATGFGMVWTSGSGMVQIGTLVDATVGSEVNAGGTLTIGHRYLVGTDTALVVTSNTAQWMAEGVWTVTPGDPVYPPVAMHFTDVVQGAWYYDDVSYVYQNGLFNGVSATEFGPLGKMQRCMMTTVLHRLAGEPAVNYSTLFQDVPDGQWYTKGTIWAGQNGIVSGVGDNRFNPSANVTRQEIAVILYRYAERMGYDVRTAGGLSGFSDSASVPSWGRDAMSWAVGAGILNGSNGALRPGGDATRAEVAAMLHRFNDWTKR